MQCETIDKKFRKHHMPERNLRFIVYPNSSNKISFNNVYRSTKEYKILILISHQICSNLKENIYWVYTQLNVQNLYMNLQKFIMF